MDKVIEHRWTGIVCIGKQRRECEITNFVILGDQNVAIKKQEKIDKYHDLRIELQKIWFVMGVVISGVIGALGTMSKRIHQYIKQIDILIDISIQKTAILETAYSL